MMGTVDVLFSSSWKNPCHTVRREYYRIYWRIRNIQVISLEKPIIWSHAPNRTLNSRAKYAIRIYQSFWHKIASTLLDFQTCDDLSAKSTADIILSTLRWSRLDWMKKRLLANATTVHLLWVEMKPVSEQELKRPIPYVHCFIHRLLLVMICSIYRVRMAKKNCAELQLLYNVFPALK